MWDPQSFFSSIGQLQFQTTLFCTIPNLTQSYLIRCESKPAEIQQGVLTGFLSVLHHYDPMCWLQELIMLLCLCGCWSMLFVHALHIERVTDVGRSHFTHPAQPTIFKLNDACHYLITWPYSVCVCLCTVEPLLKDSPNNGHHINYLSTKDTF